MKPFWIVYICLFCLGSISVNSNSIKSDSVKEDETEYPWKSLLDVSDDTFEKMIIPSSIDWQSEVFKNHSKISLKCRAMLGIALDNVHQRKAWAVQLFSSWAKFPPSGTWHGTMTDFGDYDQCMDVSRPGQYCLIDVSFPMPPIPQWHNLYQETSVFPSLSSDVLSNKTRRLIQSKDGIYSSLANVSSIFYYVYIQTGVCLPDECSSESDVRAIGNLSKLKLHFPLTFPIP